MVIRITVSDNDFTEYLERFGAILAEGYLCIEFTRKMSMTRIRNSFERYIKRKWRLWKRSV